MDYAETGANLNTKELIGAFNDVRRDLTKLVELAKSNYAGMNLELRRQAEERPLAVLGAAFGVGFVLGGGVFSRFFLTAAVAAGRAALSRQLPGILSSVLAGQEGQGYEGQQSMMEH